MKQESGIVPAHVEKILRKFIGAQIAPMFKGTAEDGRRATYIQSVVSSFCFASRSKKQRDIHHNLNKGFH
jgi:hypothetical protein